MFQVYTATNRSERKEVAPAENLVQINLVGGVNLYQFSVSLDEANNTLAKATASIVRYRIQHSARLRTAGNRAPGRRQ